ncbi:MAG: hypothetical protein MJ003_01590 [Paludibacteraceae bacterium]|nr:hypothetical protein [Paludibacteraceae bacterium]
MSKSDSNYLMHKHTGGVSNSRGNTYENYYVVKEILLLSLQYSKCLESVFLTQQKSDCFVDDLVIRNPDIRIYCQLKNQQSLTWSSGKGDRTLLSDFKRQAELCRKNGEVFKLRLVYSASDADINGVPADISDCTECEFFNGYSSLSQMVQSDVFNGWRKTCPLDKMDEYATMVLGTWCSQDRNDTEVSISKFFTQVESKFHAKIPAIGYDESAHSIIAAVLPKIAGIEYQIADGSLLISYQGTQVSCLINSKLLDMLKGLTDYRANNLLLNIFKL